MFNQLSTELSEISDTYKYVLIAFSEFSEQSVVWQARLGESLKIKQNYKNARNYTIFFTKKTTKNIQTGVFYQQTPIFHLQKLHSALPTLLVSL